MRKFSVDLLQKMYVHIYDESHVFIRDSSIFFTFEPTPYSVLSPLFLISVLESLQFAVFSLPLKLCVNVIPWLVLPMRPEARGLAQHGGPPSGLGESDLACVYMMDGPYCLPFPYRTGCLDRSCPAAS